MLGLLGWYKLKYLASLEDSGAWRHSFSNKKVLIVGSGPSLDGVPRDYFERFDCIVYINHAIKRAGKAKDEYFFSTDVKVAKRISKEDYYSFIDLFGVEKSILAPVFFQQVIFLTKEFKKRFSFIRASESFYKIHYASSFYGVPVSAVLWPAQADYKAMEFWFSRDHQVNFFPVFETTSALSAILFVAKYMPESIRLIGCDFGGGRAKNIQVDFANHEANRFEGAVEKFFFIQSFLGQKGIDLKNDSWP